MFLDLQQLQLFSGQRKIFTSSKISASLGLGIFLAKKLKKYSKFIVIYVNLTKCILHMHEEGNFKLTNVGIKYAIQNITNHFLMVSTLILFNGLIFSQDDFSDDNTSESILTISGKITNEANGYPLAGANIVIEDTDIGAASDEEGNYTIEGVEAGANIVVHD